MVRSGDPHPALKPQSFIQVRLSEVNPSRDSSDSFTFVLVCPMMSSLPALLGLAPPDFIYVTDASAHRLAAATVADALASLNDTPTALVNAVACFTPRLFYDTVLNALAD